MTHEGLAERASTNVFRDFAASAVRARLRKLENEMVRNGVVQVFDIIRYPKLSRAYTWSSSAEGSAGFFAAFN